jgi:hypothetical protein
MIEYRLIISKSKSLETKRLTRLLDTKINSQITMSFLQSIRNRIDI